MFNLHEKIFLLIVDFILVISSILISLLVRFFEEPDAFYKMLNWVDGIHFIKILLLSFLCIITFYFFDLYGKVWRYAGINELISIFNSVTLSYIIFSVPVFIYGGSFFPRSVTVISWLMTVMLVGGIRMLLKWVSLRQKKRSLIIPEKLLVVGTGDEAEAYIREVLRQEELPYRPVGFVDLDGRKKNVIIHGVKVLGTIEDIPVIVPRYDIEQITIALPEVSGQLINKIMSMGKQLQVKVAIIPSVSEILDGKVTLTQTREIRIEDLLGREPVKFDTAEVADYIKGQRILVTGAGGSIGRELCRQILKLKPQSITLLGHGENSIHEAWLELQERAGGTDLKQVIADIRNKEKICKIFEGSSFTVVFHAAAHKHVPLMEKNPDEAIGNNILGTRNLAYAADKYGVNNFVMVSTDKAVEPLSVMGGSKKIAENVVRAFSESSKTRFVIVRFGNVLGSRGSVVQTFKEQIKKGGPVTVTDPEMTRYFMTCPEAVLLILQAASMGKGGEIFVLDMGRPVNIFTLAKNLIELSGYEPEKDIPVVFTGTRQGDKMTEVLHNKEEELLKTKHPKIFSVKTAEVDKDKVFNEVEELEELLKKLDFDKLFEKFKKIVPSIIRNLN